MEHWLNWAPPDGRLETIVDALTTDQNLDVDRVSVKQIDHLLEAIQREGLDRGRWRVTLHHGDSPWNNRPTTGKINYLAAVLWLKARGWFVSWCNKTWWLEICLVPPDGGY